jgi:uncharacterized protein YodC (DUF2158 family)
MAFKVGEIVQLKSGGPKMTVTDIPAGSYKDYYSTSWFAGAKLEHGHFPEDSLMPAKEGDKK